MRKFLDKARDAIKDLTDDDKAEQTYNAPQKRSMDEQQQVLAVNPPPAGQPSRLDVMRYRYHHGTNLGSIYVLEKWLHPSMFPSNAPANATAELPAAQLAIKEMGTDGARAKFQRHWDSAISDDDFRWLVNDAHCTSIRLPIGYFTLGPNFCKNTPFASVSALYANAWNSVKILVARCNQNGIGVLVDLHALPGGANDGEHSGTNSGKTELWNNSANLDLATRCLSFIAQEVRNGMDGVLGIQLCNEAVYNASGMYAWYDKVLGNMASIDNTIPIYISDAWNLGQAVGYVNKKNSLSRGYTNPVVIDTHLYWAFTPEDQGKSPQQITGEVASKLKELDGKDGSLIDHGAAQVVVGEYSNVLSEQSWNLKGNGDRGDLIKKFGTAQSKRYQQRSGGSYFWTYKMDWMDGGEWGFAQQTKSTALPAPFFLTLPHSAIRDKLSSANSQQDATRTSSVNSHVNYWNSQSPGQPFEHWRFEAGWKMGWADAAVFFGMRAGGNLKGPGGDKIGCLDLWVRKRMIEVGQPAQGPFAWEFEQGFRRGVQDFYGRAGV
ncbi:glycoside hydrolase family 5 protein [Aulographum hederae CBS 113979]|uniref:Glycoside hydrolase family 5 protein n=1 Tax=Aulographum hederae CBS 113979 TaxID=1176131 RepID=A0A6G1GT76_9PEZI|nr:glycoside hydrolase family 5 protein [Aulographum hederae CBS 113979]